MKQLFILIQFLLASVWLSGQTQANRVCVKQDSTELKFLQDEGEGEFAGGYTLTPDYKIISVPDSKNLTTDGVSEEYLITGALPGFVVIKDNVENFYIWNGTQYVNKSDAADIYSVEFVENPATSRALYLFYNLQNGCGDKNYIVTTYSNQIKSTLANTDKTKITTDITSIITALIPAQGKQLPCGNPVTAGNEWTEVDIKLNCAAADIQNAIREGLKKITSATKAAEVNAILKELYSPCLFVSIPFDKRIEILNILLQDGVDDEQWAFGYGALSLGDKFFLDDLILSTPEKDRKRLLIDGFMSNNHKWLQRLWDKSKNAILNNDVVLDDIVPLLNELSLWVMQYYNELDIPITTEKLQIGDALSVDIAAGINPVLLGKLNDSFIWHYSSADNKRFDYSLPEDNYGGITFDKGKITINQAQREIIHTNTLGANGLEITETSYPRYRKTFNPFEPVTVWIGNSYSFLGLSAGDENTQIVVPAILAALYLQQIHNDNTQHTFRQVGNGAAITAALLSAPYSGGTSLQAYAAAVSVGAGYVAAADAAMQEVKQKYVEDGSFVRYQDIFSKWDVFYAGAALLDGGVNVAAVAKSIDVVRLANNLKTAVRTATATTKTTLRNNLIALYAHWIIEVKGLKNIDNLTAAERQLLTEQDEVFHVLGASQYSATGKALTWEEAVRFGSRKLPSFDIGEEIASTKIAKVKQGTNGKVAVIGLKMSERVEPVGETLVKQGYDVELFNAKYQSEFTIDGKKYTWQQIADDLSGKNPIFKYERINDYVIDADIPNTLMFKANKQFAEKLVREDYTVISLDNSSTSQWFNMEFETIFK